MLNTSQKLRRRVAELLALPMFFLSMLFLVILAVLIVLWVDVPLGNYSGDDAKKVGAAELLKTEPKTPPEVEPESQADTEPATEPEAEPEAGPKTLPETEPETPAETEPATEPESEPEAPLVSPLHHITAPSTSPKVLAAFALGFDCLRVMLLLWPVFVFEFLLQLLMRDSSMPFWRDHYYGLIICICPPLRLCARNQDMDGTIWLPRLGWQEVNDTLRARLEALFSVPMILIALTILPVLLIEFGMKHQVAARPWLQTLLHCSMGVIWFAFAIEFIVMVSVAEKKLRYCREHWIDIAIIVLPLISFLRSLRIIRALRLARLAKVQQLTKMGRLYRLRGLATRAIRALLLLQLFNRIIGITPEKQLRKLREQLKEKEVELESLRRVIADLEEQVKASDSK